MARRNGAARHWRRRSARRSRISRRGYPTSARSSPTCAPPRWTNWGSRPPSRRCATARAATAWRSTSSIELAYEQGREPTRHTPELETAIYRIIQEALTNASKHGHAKRAVIEIRENASDRRAQRPRRRRRVRPSHQHRRIWLDRHTRARGTAAGSGPDRILPRQRHHRHRKLPRATPPHRGRSLNPASVAPHGHVLTVEQDRRSSNRRNREREASARDRPLPDRGAALQSRPGASRRLQA